MAESLLLVTGMMVHLTGTMGCLGTGMGAWGRVGWQVRAVGQVFTSIATITSLGALG